MTEHQLDQIRERLLQRIERAQDETVATLQRLIQFPTVNPPGNEEAHQEYVADQLRELGLETHLLSAEAGRPNVVAILRGARGGRHLLHYAGHADVVDAGDPSDWRYPPFGGEVHDGWIWGRGAVDHKAPIAASLAALRALIACDVRLAGDVVVMVPVDEEQGSIAGTRFLLEQGVLYGDMGIYASAGFLDEILIACSGTLRFEVTVRGRASHSGYPQRGTNAVLMASRLVQALQEMRFEKVNPFWEPDASDKLRPTRTGTLTVTAIRGGGNAFNVVPDTCIVRGSRRLIPNETVAEGRVQIEEMVTRLTETVPGFHADVRFLVGVPGINTAPDDPVVDAVAGAVRDLGLQPQIGGSSGGFDARYIVQALGIPFVSYGAGWNGPDGGLCLHTANETITVENLMGMSKAYAMIMVRACGLADVGGETR